jgi:hypothetical protein
MLRNKDKRTKEEKELVALDVDESLELESVIA